MITPDHLRRAGLVAGVMALMPATALATNAVHGLVAQRNSAQARVGALQQRLQHQPVRVVTAPPAPGAAGGTSPSPAPAVSGSITVIAADHPNAGTGRSSSGGGGGARPGPTTPGGPSTPTSQPTPPPSRPPRTADCSTIRVAAQTPPLGVLACGTLHTAARIGSPVR